MARVTLSFLAASILVALGPALARAQSHEPNGEASSPPESAGTEASPADPGSGAGPRVPVPQAVDDERPPNVRAAERPGYDLYPRQRESAIGYDSEAPSRRPRGWQPPAPTLHGWRLIAADGLRARLHAGEREAAAETARREADSGAFRDHGIVGMVTGAAGVVGGVITLLVSAFRNWHCSSAFSCSGFADHAGVVAGSVFVGVGGLAVITGGILFSQRPRRVLPGEVTLTLGQGSLEVMW